MSALKGIRILELAEGVAGEYCGKLLADFGAEVIKVERPGGSPTRTLGPFGPGQPNDGLNVERSGLFAYLNTSKREVVLDLESPAGRAALDRLIGAVDAVVDDHAPGWLAGVGLDPATTPTARPSLVLCAITPFGQSAPEARRHAEDLTVFHASGWGYHTPSAAKDGQPPLKGAGRFMVSYEAGLEAAMCVVASLYGRDVSGGGQVIDLSKQEVMASRVDYVLAAMAAGEMEVGAARTAFDLGGPAGIFPCREGFAYIWMSSPEHWKALGELLGHPDWMKAYPEHWLEREATPERVAEVRRYIGEWLATQDKHEAAAAAQTLGLIVAAVNDPSDLPHNPQFAFRGFFAEVEHPVLGKALYPKTPYLLSATPATLSGPAPLLGQHTEQTLAAMAAPVKA